MGFTQTWEQFLVCRILLGITEAGFLPGKACQKIAWTIKSGALTVETGCTFLISVWYTRYEVGKRLAAFWMLSVLANGFAGILAYGLTRMDGIQGIAGWRCTSRDF